MSEFSAVIDLSTLDGLTGFRIDGIDASDQSGFSVSSAGDVNGDGFDDLIIGAWGADPGGDGEAGETYVVFGKASGFLASLDLSTLDGVNGFRLDGIDANDQSGWSVSSAGDLNGDGFDDLVVSAKFADPGGDVDAGESYVVFGKASGFTTSLDLATLNGSNGFRLDGIDPLDYSGLSVSSAGDVNGDGFDDLIIGAYGADPGGDSSAGETYVVFGKASGFAASFDLATLNGSNGFRLDGIDPNDQSGWSVSSAGDVNGDGFDDIIIGANFASPGGDSAAGESYVVFGKASGFTASLDLSSLDGSNGFRVDGIDTLDQSGLSVSSAGDVNGDGYDDIIIGATLADPGGDSAAGESYVVFGKASGFTASLDLSTLDGTNGFRLDGIDTNDFSGASVSSAGDVNGDGFDDLIIGAWGADAGGDANAGESYVVFGKASGFAASLDLSTLDGTNGFRLDGIDASDNSGRTVSSAGDINGDGFDDIVIGAPGGDAGGDSNAGESYVVFGRAPTSAVTRIGGAADQAIYGGAFDDHLNGLEGNDFLSGSAGIDLLEGAFGNARDVNDAQVFRLYQTMLARQPDEGGKEYWASQLFDQTLDVVSMAAGFESSPEFQTTYGGLDNAGFVTLLYNNVLGRDPESAGEAYWLNELSNGATRAEVAAGFSESNEFVDLTEATNAYYLSSGIPLGLTDDVFRLYQATLDRDPDMPGLMGWLITLGTGQPKVVVAEGFVASTEFQTTYGGLNDSDFINLLYNNVLDRDADTVGEAYWLNEIANGATRAEVVLGFSDSPEFISNTAEAVNTWMRTTPGTANDVLFGGADDDRMFGGFGADSFVFDNTMDGADFVGDLERWDTLVFNNFGYTDKADVLANMAQVDQDVVFSDQGNSITFAYTTLADLDHADMFSFDDTSVLV